MLSVKELL